MAFFINQNSQLAKINSRKTFWLLLWLVSKKLFLAKINFLNFLSVNVEYIPHDTWVISDSCNSELSENAKYLTFSCNSLRFPTKLYTKVLWVINFERLRYKVKLSNFNILYYLIFLKNCLKKSVAVKGLNYVFSLNFDKIRRNIFHYVKSKNVLFLSLIRSPFHKTIPSSTIYAGRNVEQFLLWNLCFCACVFDRILCYFYFLPTRYTMHIKEVYYQNTGIVPDGKTI